MTEQSTLEAYFAAQSSYWRDVYSGDDVNGVIYRQRQAIALAWVDSLGLPAGARILEIGCGAGFVAVSLASRGFEVEASDSVPEMLELAGAHAAEAGVEERIRFSSQDAHALAFDDGSFDLVIALGVLPWLHTPQRGAQEVARVLAPGGAFIGSVDSATRLHYRFDPKLTPALAGARRALRTVSRHERRREAAICTMLTQGEFDRLLVSAGLERERMRGFGYGPFTVLGRPVLPARVGVAVHRRLQALADGGSGHLARGAAQYIALARKRP
ncbi:MAG TPA: class I SAM-dependent methyltransferase [Thermoleophilaceae bacterium]|nr:class I SAM-dependent methyltransferase [Thermoleophilaceae bacterium]